MLNTYQTIRLGNVDFLILCLDYCPSDEVLNWANKIVKNHPNHNVIISTHSYLSDKGTPLSEKVTGNDGAGMWNKLISKHKNIVLTLSGHITWDEIVIAQAQGSKGNTVTQILVDPQGTDGTLKGRMADGLVGGLVAMLYFSEDGRQVAVEYVSTARNQYYMSSNLQSFTLDIQDIAQDRANEYARSVENALASAITKDNFATKKVVIASLREEYEVMSAAVKAKVPAQTLALLQEAEQTIADFESPTVPQEQIPNEEQQKQPKEAPSVLLPILIGIGVAVITAAVILLAIGKKKKTAK
jgi:flagellar basal body-associated protein FliL